MAVSQVGSSSTGSTTTSTLSITKPTDTTQGDVLIAVITSNNQTQSAPSGWTNFDGQNASPLGTAWQVQLYWKVAGPSEPGSYSWTTGTDSGAGAGGLIQTWRGVSNSSPIDGTNDDIVASGVGEPYAGLSVSVDSSAGRVFCVRGVRQASAGGNAGSMSTSTSGASWHVTASGFSGTGNTLYSVGIFSFTSEYTTSGSKPGCNSTWSHSSGNETANYRATFALRADTPVDGALTTQLPKVASTLAGEREIPAGGITAQLPKLSATFTAMGAPPEGSLATALPKLSAALTATSVGGGIIAELPSIQSDLVGAVNPIGGYELQLPSLESSFVSETSVFGEHVIRVEKEHRALLVVDDGVTSTGLKPIKRSKISEQ